MLDNGATTVWEWWDGINKGEVRGSLNHYSKAAVLSFLHTHVAGIQLNDQPTADEAGYRFVTIAPVPGGGLEWARHPSRPLTDCCLQPGASTTATSSSMSRYLPERGPASSYGPFSS